MAAGPGLKAIVATALVAVGLAAGSAAQGQGNPVVVELFSSQGCASCPPADRILAELAPREDVIALALHVDYWDYLGWADAFAQPGFTRRQKRYAAAANQRMVYTPQMIVAGAELIPGGKRAKILDAITRHAALPPRVGLVVERAGNRLLIRAEADPPLDRTAVVHLVRYRPEDSLTILRGENAGREATYHNIVTAWEALTEWSGRAPLAIEADADGAAPVVVIVQEQGPGAVLAAARLR